MYSPARGSARYRPTQPEICKPLVGGGHDLAAGKNRFIIVAAKRARQLQNGARPFLPTTSKKPTVIAMEEVRRGLVKYELLNPVVPVVEEPEPEAN